MLAIYYVYDKTLSIDRFIKNAIPMTTIGSLENMLENHHLLTIARLLVKLNLYIEKGSEAERKLNELLFYCEK
jgi:hypothetical protein